MWSWHWAQPTLRPSSEVDTTLMDSATTAFLAVSWSAAGAEAVPSGTMRRKPVAESVSTVSGAMFLSGPWTSSSPASCSWMKRSRGLSALSERMT